MHQTLLWMLLVVLSLVPGTVTAVTNDDFQVRTTQNLINLCSVSRDDARAEEAIHFCHGYLVGAYHYHLSENEGPGGERLVCIPEQGPSRNEGVAMFVQWAKEHPQYMQEKPVETEFRFFTEKWPCKK